jgi:hypothetical protein
MSLELALIFVTINPLESTQAPDRHQGCARKTRPPSRAALHRSANGVAPSLQASAFVVPSSHPQR